MDGIGSRQSRRHGNFLPDCVNRFKVLETASIGLSVKGTLEAIFFLAGRAETFHNRQKQPTEWSTVSRLLLMSGREYEEVPGPDRDV